MQIENIPTTCTGCAACYSQCPVQAISMQEDIEGFLFPQIDYEVCTRCETCDSICPVINMPDFSGKSNTSEKDYYAFLADNETRDNSSSGGVFTLAARKIWCQGGYVAGAAFSHDFEYVHHIVTNDPNELSRLAKSKYIQSKIEQTFTRIQDLLSEGKQVLFCGCPCQVAGLQAFLSKEYLNLITIDFVCRGVPSAKVWQAYLKEILGNSELKKVDCRSKLLGWGVGHLVEFEDGFKHLERKRGIWHRRNYLKKYSLRKCCYSCRFSGSDRYSDITIADFFNIKDYDKSLDDGQGTSLLQVNTKKGKALLSSIESEALVCKKILIEGVHKYFVARLADQIPATRERFFTHIDDRKFSTCVEYAEGRHFDIGLVGWYYNRNKGGALTFYALHQALRHLGLSVAVIREPGVEHSHNSTLDIVGDLYQYTEPLPRARMSELSGRVDTFVVASDQLWNYKICGSLTHYFALEFASSNNRKVSVATSFGETELAFTAPEDKSKFAENLRRFDAVSVREESGVILSESLGVNAALISDPVFLLNDDDIDALIVKKPRDGNSVFMGGAFEGSAADEPFLFAYFLSLRQEQLDFIHQIALEKKLGVKIMVGPGSKSGYAKNYEQQVEIIPPNELLKYADISDFLFYAKHADFIVTNSFHGTCFSLIFHKNFITLRHIRPTRLETLLGRFGLLERFVDPATARANLEILLTDINYSQITPILNALRQKDREWLAEAVCPSRYNTKIVDEEETSPDWLRSSLTMRAAKVHEREKALEEKSKTLAKSSIPASSRTEANSSGLNEEAIANSLYALSLADYSAAQHCLSKQWKNVILYTEKECWSFAKYICGSLVTNRDIKIKACVSDVPFREALGNQSIYGSYVSKQSDSQVCTREDHVLVLRPSDNAKFLEKAKAVGAKITDFSTLLKDMISHAFVQRPLDAFRIANPNVRVITCNMPKFPRSQRSLLEEQIVSAKATYNRVKAALNNGELIVDSYRPYGYSLQDIKTLLSEPRSYLDAKGVKKFEDYRSDYVTTQNGNRKTCFQPNQQKGTIYFLGGCQVYGMGVPDEKTIPSQLQQMANERCPEKEYRVENRGFFAAGRREDIFRALFDLPVIDGDIVVLGPTPLPESATGITVNLSNLFQRPHKYGDVFLDSEHLNENGSRIVAETIFDEITKNKFLSSNPLLDKPYFFGVPQEMLTSDIPYPLENDPGLASYKEQLIAIREATVGKVGSIVMNCNPFTLGHRYLIEYAASLCSHLFVFVVQEDKSYFPFDDRIRLVKEGTSDLENVTVLPSGDYIISSLTFSDYFNKAELQDKTINPTMDVLVFAKEIAPVLGITVRFVGEEPYDLVTRQYNETMRTILPRFGVEFVEIERKQKGETAISASRVRDLLSKGCVDEIRELVPDVTFNYLRDRFNL